MGDIPRAENYSFGHTTKPVAESFVVPTCASPSGMEAFGTVEIDVEAGRTPWYRSQSTPTALPGPAPTGSDTLCHAA
jgi:hypothetical protein